MALRRSARLDSVSRLDKKEKRSAVQHSGGRADQAAKKQMTSSAMSATAAAAGAPPSGGGGRVSGAVPPLPVEGITVLTRPIAARGRICWRASNSVSTDRGLAWRMRSQTFGGRSHGR
jgi:hypothetical protein